MIDTHFSFLSFFLSSASTLSAFLLLLYLQFNIIIYGLDLWRNGVYFRGGLSGIVV